MLKKADIESALKNAGIEIYDETPGARGGWTFMLGGIPGGLYVGHAEAIVGGLESAEKLERLCAHFNQREPD
jgi:hypothetical protein